MGKISCECGYIHSDTCGYDGDLFKYREWEAVRFPGIQPEPLNVFECHLCGNIMIDDPKDEKIMITYRPSNSKFNALLKEE